MSEWWSYTLSDFLLFSPRTYYRLFERLNDDLWPGHLLALALGLTLLVLLSRGTPRRWRLATGMAAIIWAFVAVVFLWRRYQPINWAAVYFGWGFMAEALLLLWYGLRDRGTTHAGGTGIVRITGFALLAFSLAVFPWIAALAGRPWRQAEMFGLAPDPTVIGTLGVILLVPRRRLLLIFPLLWCAITGATLWAMRSPEAWVAPLAGVLSLAALAIGAFRSRRAADLPA